MMDGAGGINGVVVEVVVVVRDIPEGTQPYIGTLTLAHPQP